MAKIRLRRNDDVIVIAGSDRGKQGKILSINAKQNTALVQGVNMIKRHKKPDQNTREGGIITSEGPISISNLAYMVKAATKTKPAIYSKLAVSLKKQEGKTTKTRVVKRTSTEI